MIGSHNTFSYLPPKNFWGKITRLWNKCQDKNIKAQYDAGVRYFDIRIRLVGTDWHIVHNKVDYGLINIDALAKIFNDVVDNTIYLRIILDERVKPKDYKIQTEKFIYFINTLQCYLFEDIHIDSAIIYWEWKELLKPSIEVKEYHASVSAEWYQYIFGTKKFAKLSNRYARQTYYYYAEDNERVLLLDYV